MGLDITTYTTVKKVEHFPENRETWYDADWVGFYQDPCFAGREGSIDLNAPYEFEDAIGFRAGSYGGYNRWREELAEIAGYPKTLCVREGQPDRLLHAAACWDGGANGPFSELINFSDCEGTIGPELSLKLTRDFESFEPIVSARCDEYFMENYRNFKQAFYLASITHGAVVFH